MKVLGALLFIMGIGLGLYCGLWWGFIGGVIQVVEAFKAPDISAMQVALGLLRFWFAGVIGTLAGIIPCFIGASMMDILK